MENHGREEEAAAIPLIDLSPFFNHHADQRDRDRVIAAVGKACEEWGFFQVTNHGVPVDLIEEALDTCRVFFEYPAEEKMKVRGQVSVPQQMPTGYNVYPPGSWDLYENLYYRAGRSSPGQTSSDFSDGNAHCNAFPEDLPQLRSNSSCNLFLSLFPITIKKILVLIVIVIVRQGGNLISK